MVQWYSDPKQGDTGLSKFCLTDLLDLRLASHIVPDTQIEYEPNPKSYLVHILSASKVELQLHT